jgi:hypothetical protein
MTTVKGLGGKTSPALVLTTAVWFVMFVLSWGSATGVRKKVFLGLTEKVSVILRTFKF